MSRNALSILSSDDKLIEFKNNALQQANKFDISNIVPQYEALYKKFIP